MPTEVEYHSKIPKEIEFKKIIFKYSSKTLKVV